MSTILTAGKWVLREDGSGTRAGFVKALASLGVPYGKLNIAIELPSNEAVLAAVLVGVGATVLSARVCADGVKAGTLKLLSVPPMPRPRCNTPIAIALERFRHSWGKPNHSGLRSRRRAGNRF